MGRNVLIGALLGLLIWFGGTIVYLENRRYALELGMCADANLAAQYECLEEVETRTHFLWHLLYGLGVL